MLYLQYQLHKIWGEPYKRAALGVKPQIMTENDPEY